MSSAVIWLAAWALGLGAGLHAASDDIPILDNIANQKATCLLSHIGTSADGTLGPASCFRRSTEETRYIDGLTQDFCTNPARFCGLVRGNRPPATDDSIRDRDRYFVSPRCERFHRDVSNRLYGASSSADSRLADMMRQAWGCRPGVTRVVNSGPLGSDPRTEVVREYDCDAARMPFNCATGAATRAAADGESLPTGSDSASVERRAEIRSRRMGVEVNEILAPLSISIADGSLHPNGGRCTVRADEGRLVLGGTGLPAINAGESLEAYRARLSPTERERLASREATVQNSSNRVFNSAAALMGVGSTRFRAATAAILTPERLALARKSFLAAQEGVLEYLRTLTPRPPEAILDRVRRTELTDLEAFTRNPKLPGDAAIMNKYESACKTADNTAFGYHQAVNSSHRHPHPPGNGVMLCPSLLLDMDLSNPRGLLTWLGHEIGHSIDPCALGQTQTGVRYPTDGAHCSSGPTPAIPAAQAAAVTNFVNSVNGPGGVVECLHAPSGLPSGTPSPVRGSDLDLRRRYGQALRQDHCGGVTSANMCAFNRYIASGTPPVTGPLAYCSLDFSGDTAFVTNSACPHARPLLNQLNNGFTASGQKEQAQEAFADIIGAHSLTFAMNSTQFAQPRLNDLQAPEKKAEILTTMTDFCYMGTSPGDEHPAADYRTSVFASAPNTRRALGCSAASPAGTAFPTASCASRMGSPP